MKKNNKAAILTVSAAAIVAVGLVAVVWGAYFSGGASSFELPPPFPLTDELPSTEASELASAAQSATPLLVSLDNVRTLLASIERPSAYHQTFSGTIYWQGGSERTTHNIARRGDLSRAETIRANAPPQHRLVTPQTIYVWSGAAIHEVAPSGASAESLSGIPTWEDIISLPDEGGITQAEFLYHEGERALRLSTREAIYYGEYLISLEYGLLIFARFTDPNGLSVYEIEASGSPAIGEFEDFDYWFTLPDGRVVN